MGGKTYLFMQLQICISNKVTIEYSKQCIWHLS